MIEKERADKRLHGVCEDLIPGTTRVLRLPAREKDGTDKLKVGTDLGKRLGSDKRSAKIRELPFRMLRKCRKEVLGDHKLEHRITQEFESLIVRAFPLRMLI